MSNGPEFFQTPMGRRYYESTLPKMVETLERIAKAMEDANRLKGKPVECVNLDGTPAKEGDQ